MKKISLISAALLAATVFSATSAMAAPSYRHGYNGYTGVDIQQLERRIDRGVRSGKLVGWEERQLRGELHRLVRALRDARRDHRITRFERSRLERKEANLKYNISKLMNNREVARNDHRWGDNRGWGNNNHRWNSHRSWGNNAPVQPAPPTPFNHR
jgi:hypothetical protein